MHRHARNFDSLRRNAKVDQLLLRFFAGHQVKTDVVASPSFPKSVIRIGDHGHQRNTIRKLQLPEHAREDVLSQRMYADDNVRTPALKKLAHITDATRMKELARFRSKAVDGPVKILHPMLLVTQQPVVETNQPVGDRRRFFHRAHHANRIRFAFDEALNAGHDRGCGRAMTAAGIGRNDQNLRSVGVHTTKCQKPDRKGGQLSLTTCKSIT